MRQEEVEKKAREINHTLKFGEDLLTEGSDFEVKNWRRSSKSFFEQNLNVRRPLQVLSFAFYLLQRLEWCIKSGSSALSSAFTSCVGTLQFLPEERAGTIRNKAVFGVVTTQIVSPSNCYITPEGKRKKIKIKNNYRVHDNVTRVD